MHGNHTCPARQSSRSKWSLRRNAKGRRSRKSKEDGIRRRGCLRNSSTQRSLPQKLKIIEDNFCKELFHVAQGMQRSLEKR